MRKILRPLRYVNTVGEKQQTEWPHPEETEMTKAGI